MQKVLLTGGAGRLGREILKLGIDGYEILSPNRSELDLSSPNDVFDFLTENKPELIIHCAADTDLPGAQKNPKNAIRDNVIATSNIVIGCITGETRLVFISTSHVFDGRKGRYLANDPINPLGNYAKTKAAAELVARTHSNSLTIRVEFFGNDFPYDVAFDDKFASKLYSDEIAPMIIKESLSNNTGVIHLDIPRRSIYEIARERKSNVRKASILEYAGATPNLIDTSLVGGIYCDRER